MKLTRFKNIADNEAKEILFYLLGTGKASMHIRLLAERAVAGHEDQIRAVYNFVKDNFPYQADPEGMELFISPARMAEDFMAGTARRGDCDDLSLLTASMLGSLGYKARIALVAQGMDYDHVTAEVWSEELQDWLVVDVTSEYPLGWVFVWNKKLVIE